jgi:phosphoglycerate kinase
MRCIDELSKGELENKYVLVRSGLDLPLSESGAVTDTFRVQRACATLRFLSENGAKTIILSHIGRDPEESNEPVAAALRIHLPVSYVPDLLGHAAQSARDAMLPGDILLLENLRRDPREVAGDEVFAQELSRLGEIYVNDAFSASHRAHASVVGVPKFLPHYAGMVVRDEIQQLDLARAPLSPSFAILGGAKFETKSPLIDSLLQKYDHLFITGALANDVFKAKGLPVGRSLISKELPAQSVLENPRFIAPIDVTAENEEKQAKVKNPEAVEASDKIVDIGPDSVSAIAPLLSEAKFILWNGPTGLYEDGYASYTHAIAEVVAHAVAHGAQAVIGGGDTIAAIIESGMSPKALGFLSTGGGAMLEYLLKGTLPGIAALE